MTNPHSPEVRQRFLNMLTEVAQTYAVDGFIFDDRLRYASLNADFSVPGAKAILRPTYRQANQMARRRFPL